MDRLRSFVWKMSIIYRINMVDVRDNLDKWRMAVDCRAAAAAGQQAVPVAGEAPAADTSDAAGVHVAAR
jgi:hypothetical protein